MKNMSGDIHQQEPGVALLKGCVAGNNKIEKEQGANHHGYKTLQKKDN